MTYKGKYKVINPNKYRGDHLNVVYRSMWEKDCFRWLDNNSDVKYWSSEEVVVPYLFAVDKKWHRYFVDIKYTTNDGRTFLIEIKPAKQTKPPTGQSKKSKQYVSESITYVQNQCKWEAATKYAVNQGWEFQVWTEHTLYELGIMTKPVGRLKPLKPFKKVTKSKSK